MFKVAINGFGRIGKLALKSIVERGINLDVVAINDLSGTTSAAHLFAFDSAYGQFAGTVSHSEDSIIINDKKIAFYAEKNPEDLPWKELEIDIVLECTGFFRTKELASKHLKAGAKRVIISAPAKDEIDATFVMGINNHDFDPNKHFIISNASCTTNCLAPIVKILHENFIIKKGLMTTIHAFTSSQPVIDCSKNDLRRSRAAAEGMIPTSTGAAKAISLVMPEMKNKLDGFAMRVPSLTVSVIDLTFETEKEISKDSINQALKNAANNKLKGILGYETRPLVSNDFRKDLRSSIVDAQLTNVIDKNFAKVISWYDNEWGYASRLVDLAEYISKN